MAKADLKGTWVTIDGRHIFIEDSVGGKAKTQDDDDDTKRAKTKETTNKPKEEKKRKEKDVIKDKPADPIKDDEKKYYNPNTGEGPLTEKDMEGSLEREFQYLKPEDYKPYIKEDMVNSYTEKFMKENGIDVNDKAEYQRIKDDILENPEHYMEWEDISEAKEHYLEDHGTKESDWMGTGEEIPEPKSKDSKEAKSDFNKRPESDEARETAKANRQAEKIEKGKDDFDPVEFERWRVENDPEFEMSDDTARYIYEIDKETGSRGGSKKETAEGRLEQLKKEGKVDSTGTKAVDKETQKEVNKLYLDTHEPIDKDVWEKQEDGSFKANKDAMKADYEARHKKYDDKIKQFAEDRENMTNSDWEASIMAYEKQNADGTYKTMDQIMEDVEEYGKSKSTYMNIPQEERVKAFEEGKNWKDLVKEYNTKDSRGGLPGDDSLVEKGRKAGISDEEIADAIYERHGGAESNNTSDDNIKRLLAKKAKEDAQVNGYKDRAKMFENYEKEFNNRINQKKSPNEIMNDKIRTGIDEAKNKHQNIYMETEADAKSGYKHYNEDIIRAHDNFEKYKKYETFTDDEWNNASKEQQQKLAKDSLTNFFKDNKMDTEEMLDFKDELRNNKFHTESELIEDVYSETIGGTKSISNNLTRAVYNKYLKEHPGSKMTFEDFKKKNK